MKAKHTPGPWGVNMSNSRLSDGTIAYIPIGSENESWLGEAKGPHVGPTNEVEIIANAKLMAAAPEMLEALIDIVDAQQNPDRTLASMNSAIKNAIPIIQKATS